ncbi:hypothetical protein POTOM_026058 [Populus tomentosa]|uniref:Uncharacterized protein n=1 Tax=Populus tomentosa TaxID=118781 RepID=A0A8X8CXX1_POPTO|nr:hypothetical protein POTOM_026058 [Populus tomentosa]
MDILGKNKILPLLGKSKGSSGHRLLKYIALYLPRYERCTCKECEVLSGIFGNAFWHENVSPSLHHWLNTQSATKLPMSAFPHLRRICNSGYIVDSNGNNSFLIHPERMAISTLYISGGRSLLVTSETSYLTNKYMKLHHLVLDMKGRLAEQEGNDLTPRKKEGQQRGFGLGPLKPSFRNEVICHFMAAVYSTINLPESETEILPLFFLLVFFSVHGSVAACRMSIVGVKVRLLEKPEMESSGFPI